MSTSDILDEFFPRLKRPEGAMEKVEAQRLGLVVGGSLSKGLDVKLDRQILIEGLAVGTYVVVQGQTRRFFSMITDVALDSTNPLMEKTPPDVSDPFMADVFIGTSTFGRLHVAPMLTLEKGEEEPKPVKTVPAHFSTVYSATVEDIGRIFGREEKGYFHVGEPLDMEGIPIHISLQRLVERSSGVFGKSGTGKTFLTRMLLAGIIQQDAAVNLIFDMHNEYGWAGEAEGGYRVKGLKQLFESRVAIFTLDEDSSRRRGIHPDFVVEISYDQIEPQDIEMLREIIGLSEAAIGTIYFLHRLWGREWLSHFLKITSQEEETLIKDYGQHAGTLSALQRRLRILERFPFLKPKVQDNSVQRILEYINRGISVVLEFGRYGNSLEAYILVANYLTRRIHENYVRRKEQAMGQGGAEPPHLVIAIEEAHKFLDPQIAKQTIFGIIARELRKYNVTLLVVDQRPSGIDEEVMSQIGTRVTCLLDNEADIRAVLMGISGAGGLREVLARLDTRQQALILGHAVPMPVVIKTREYGTPEFYAALGFRGKEELKERLGDHVSLLRGEEDFEGFD